VRRYKSLIENYNTKNIKYLYHSVKTESQLNFILKNGILPDNQGFIYLSLHPVKTKFYQFSVKVKIPDNNKLHDWRDIWGEGDMDHEYDESNPYFIYEQKIPAKFLSII